jgi:glucokinase
MIFDPERVVLGGGLTDIGEPLRAGTAQWLDKLTLGGEYRPPVDIVMAELGDDAGALGAALWAHQGGA